MSGTSASRWRDSLAVFADRRVLIMLFLGFSAGIPILLIFSSLSLWLGEAGIDKKAVTFFSWAALGYSFKFVWAPLIDALPLPFLTRWLGRRRAWLLVAQCLIIVAIVIMAMSDPSQGQSGLIQMAIGAVLLGFSAATQDIVIDAYRIELAPPEIQSALAATYNAGYRLGMIVAGAGALFLASGFGTAKGNYIYQAWQSTYLIMAAVMLVGIVTTLLIREPVVQRRYADYQATDYFRLVAVFLASITAFVLGFIQLGQLLPELDDAPLQSFLLETLRFLGAGCFAGLVGYLLVKAGALNRQMAYETWVAPLVDFFKRYGVRLALTLLLLIGFFRISDILSGVISNVYYQDLNFTKEQIATAVKVYGVIFTLVGGFLGGLLAQRFNVVKVMFLGAALASATNLIFIGLIQSGAPIGTVTLRVNDQSFQALPNEVGSWHVMIPNQALLATGHIQVSSTVGAATSVHALQTEKTLALAASGGKVANHIEDVTQDNVISSDETGDILIAGRVYNLTTQQRIGQINLQLADRSMDAKFKEDGSWTAVIPAEILIAQPRGELTVSTTIQQPEGPYAFKTTKSFMHTAQPRHLHSIDVDRLPIILQSEAGAQTEVSGKVIVPYSQFWLYFAIIVDNLAAGLAGAAFIAFLSSLTSISFTAVQYAIFSSLMTLTPKLLGGYSGTIVEAIGYPKFFMMTALIGIPILGLILLVQSALKKHEQAEFTKSSQE